MRFNLRVTAEDGAVSEVSAGQRELAAWEREPFGGPASDIESKPMLVFRYLAYAALKRQWRLDHTEGHPTSFEEWDDQIDTVDLADEDDDGGPTKTDQSPAA